MTPKSKNSFKTALTRTVIDCYRLFSTVFDCFRLFSTVFGCNVRRFGVILTMTITLTDIVDGRHGYVSTEFREFLPYVLSDSSRSRDSGSGFSSDIDFRL